MLSKKQEKELLNKLPMFPHKIYYIDGTYLNKKELESLGKLSLAKLIEKSQRKKGMKIEKEEPFFGVNIKEAYHVIKNMFKKGYKT